MGEDNSSRKVEVVCRIGFGSRFEKGRGSFATTYMLLMIHRPRKYTSTLAVPPQEHVSQGSNQEKCSQEMIQKLDG